MKSEQFCVSQACNKPRAGGRGRGSRAAWRVRPVLSSPAARRICILCMNDRYKGTVRSPISRRPAPALRSAACVARPRRCTDLAAETDTDDRRPTTPHVAQSTWHTRTLTTPTTRTTPNGARRWVWCASLAW